MINQIPDMNSANTTTTTPKQTHTHIHTNHTHTEEKLYGNAENQRQTAAFIREPDASV